MNGIKGKNVLITGATSGIGEAIAIRFAKEGANVAVNYHSSLKEVRKTEKKIKNLCKKIKDCGVKEMPIKADVSKEDNAISLINKVIQEFGSLDILINNAGIQIQELSHQSKTENFKKVLSVNLEGVYFCSKKALKHFLKTKNKGQIINISSVHEVIPKPEFLSYSVSKGGLGNLTRTLALEYAKEGIRVNSIAPGAILTPINRDWKDDPKKKAMVESHIPMRRAGDPEEIAAAVIFLASREASYITGQTIYVDGGLNLYPDFEKNWSS